MSKKNKKVDAMVDGTDVKVHAAEVEGEEEAEEEEEVKEKEKPKKKKKAEKEKKKGFRISWRTALKWIGIIGAAAVSGGVTGGITGHFAGSVGRDVTPTAPESQPLLTAEPEPASPEIIETSVDGDVYQTTF